MWLVATRACSWKDGCNCRPGLTKCLQGNRGGISRFPWKNYRRVENGSSCVCDAQLCTSTRRPSSSRSVPPLSKPFPTPSLASPFIGPYIVEKRDHTLITSYSLSKVQARKAYRFRETFHISKSLALESKKWATKRPGSSISSANSYSTLLILYGARVLMYHAYTRLMLQTLRGSSQLQTGQRWADGSMIVRCKPRSIDVGPLWAEAPRVTHAMSTSCLLLIMLDCGLRSSSESATERTCRAISGATRCPSAATILHTPNGGRRHSQ